MWDAWDDNVDAACARADRVRVRPGQTPSTGWGSANASSVGIITVAPASGNVTVLFPEQSGWIGVAAELEIVPVGTGAACDAVIVSGAGYEPSNGVYVRQAGDRNGHAVYAKEGDTSRIMMFTLASDGFGFEGWILDQPGPAPYKFVGGGSHDFEASAGVWQPFQSGIGVAPMPTVVPRAPRATASGPAAVAPRFSIGAYALKAGNDCPERDPAAWTVLGLAASGAWVPLHSVASATFPGRYGWLSYARARAPDNAFPTCGAPCGACEPDCARMRTRLRAHANPTARAGTSWRARSE